ncbi:MAG: IS200/IS605 family transposase [Verrucomicrobiales bacterium]|nr:IS200/IS605 family transposase [Verrucomicrobiales bacterium]
MPSTHSALHYHIVFSTKNREPWFRPSVRERVHRYLGGIIKTMDGHPHCVGGIGDHIHLLISLKPGHRLSDVMRELKADSSGWIKSELTLAGFAWQEGYGAFTLGSPDLEKVRSYVLNQEEHHRNHSFQDEYRTMLKRGMVEFEERYLW